MRRACFLMLGVAALWWLSAGDSLAGLKEVEKGVFVEDFADGSLDQWRVDEKEKKQTAALPVTVELVKDEGKAALRLVGEMHTRLYCPDRKFKDFSMEVRMKKTTGSYAGIEVRDHWRVYFQMRGFLSLNSDIRGMEKELLKSAEQFTGYHTLKVVCAGSLLHAYVDGKHIFAHKITPGEGRVALYSHGKGEAFFQQVRITTGAAPEEYVLVEPEAPDGCLVFPPADDVKLGFKVSNYSEAKELVSVAASVKTWGGDAVKGEAVREVRAGATADATTVFDMGRIPAGFYRVDLRATCVGKQVCQIDDLPLAIQDRGSGEFKAPLIPVGAYYKYFNSKNPVYQATYAHAAARSLKENHFNTVVADLTFTPELIGIFQSYGIATVARGAYLDHPAVIATLASDEPKPEEIETVRESYARLREASGKPVTTCMVGEGIGLGGESDPVVMWRQLNPDIRCFRWYGIKKCFYDALYPTRYKGWLPLAAIFRIVEASSDSPWWFVPPALGRPDHEAYYHKPTPAQTSVMMHLAMAYGCDGLLFFAFQSHTRWPCFVDQQSLAPADENYPAAAGVAAQISTHAELLKALTLGGLDVRCPSPVVEARPLHDTRDGRVYVYAVNKDAQNAVSTRLMLWAEQWSLSRVEDIYTGRKFEVQPVDQEGLLNVPLTFAPGEGMLLLTDAVNKKAP